ncbi:MAG: hypothetical protein ACJAXJ_001770 [Colwellia sp.]|jgi:hypothetical protein
MSDLFLFRFDDESNNRKQSIVVFGANELSSDDIEAVVKKDVSIHLTPSKVYILCLAIQKQNLKDLSLNKSRVKVLSSLISSDEKCIEFIHVNQEGIFEYVENDNALDSQLQKNILEAGGIEIFKKRKGLLTSSPHYHFVKPSGAHCDKFIRVSNLLTSGNEVAFMALGVLPYITDNIKHIYVDTSSISFLIMTALQLSGKYQHELPVIESFESYSALNIKYDFIEAPTSSVFISATTSGGLNLKLEKETNLYKDKIVTLFYSQLGAGQKGTFDISSAMADGIYSTSPEKCKLCKDNSKLINIVGEQFLPEIPRHEQFLIRKPHFNRSRAKFFKEFATNGLLHFNKTESRNINEHFYVDIAGYIKNEKHSEEFIDKLYSALNKSFSRDIKTIVTLDDQGSQALSGKVKKYLGESSAEFNWVTLAQLEENQSIELNSALVIAGSITSGRKLLAASRKLRVLNKSASIKYLVGFSKLPTVSTSTQLKNDLQQGGHELIILEKCPLPRIKEHVVTAWDLEKRFFDEYDDPFGGAIKELPQILKDRKLELQGDDSQNGLFLTKTIGGKLELRDGFAFWSDLDIDCSKASQADVYWTIQTIMHDLRLANADTGLESTYHSTVLSPICFDRYNDGVIQACLIRSATPAELNYTIDEHFSRQMTDVLISIVENWNIGQGEGCLEFLLALATKRLKVLPSDLLRVLKLIHVENMDVTVKFLLEHTANKYKVELN